MLRADRTRGAAHEGHYRNNSIEDQVECVRDDYADWRRTKRRGEGVETKRGGKGGLVEGVEGEVEVGVVDGG